MRIREDSLGMERAFYVNGINTGSYGFTQATNIFYGYSQATNIFHGYSQATKIFYGYGPYYKNGSPQKIDSVIREFIVQLCCGVLTSGQRKLKK
jgi:hypothetical protein